MQKKVELEPLVAISGLEMIPVALTVSLATSGGRSGTIAVCREALAVIVADGDNPHVLLVDGRSVSLDEFLSEYPSLRDPVAGLFWHSALCVLHEGS
ncbi:MAG: hypothetical protein KAQ74_05255 [Dehalococcoidia bacterium]|nr:hypothetical protein [Dehalococcoidia bacterium]